MTKNNLRHTPQPAATLMRQAVKKPRLVSKRHVKVAGRLDIPSVSAAELLSDWPLKSVDPLRQRRAKQVSKSRLISRFGKLEPVVPVSPAQLSQPVERPFTANLQPANKLQKPPARPTTTAELFQRALEGATSHQQPAYRHLRRHAAGHSRRRRITGVSTLIAASALLIGFALYANLPTIRLHIASSRAGFAASLPGYRPAGYHLSHLNSAPGNLALEYQSNSDSRLYAIAEQNSAWTTSNLRDDFLGGLGQDYQVVQIAGRTLYIYGQNDATWLNHGIWYRVTSDGALSIHQLVQLASSM